MCLAVPMQIDKIEGTRAWVSQGGVRLEIGLDLIEEVQVGAYVIVHAGYAIHVIPQDEAVETLEIFERLGEIGGIG